MGLAAAKFDYDTDPFDSKRRDGESAEEYKTRMFANIQAAYDELLGGLDSMTSLYICGLTETAKFIFLNTKT